MAKEPQQNTPTQGPAPSQQPSPMSAQAVSNAPGQPQLVQWSIAPTTPVDTAKALREKPRVTVAFPPCTDELLALIKTGHGDEITASFNDYFKFKRHRIFGQELIEPVPPSQTPQYKELDEKLGDVIDSKLLNCSQAGPTFAPQRGGWPSECCICTPCVTLDGLRNHPEPLPTPIPDPGIQRLFIGDVVWLFFYERMGIQQILGAILDSFATTGRLPISNGSLEPSSVKDDVVALVLEVMVRQMKMGLSSGGRERGALFRTTVGWESPIARAMGLKTEVNAGFSTLFHRFIYNALEFYRDKRLAVAIQGTATVGRPSVATLMTLKDTIDLLRKRFESFDYGRNYYNTLAGIVWMIAGMAIIRELRGTLGIPTAAFDAPHEFVPAAYDLLVLNRPFSRADINRYDVHRACAINARDILLDLEVIKYTDMTPVTGELERWMTQIEAKVEGYRTAYRNLTGVDLGASATPAIEHQVAAVS
jgi:hypothetical protein